jgi:PAS domain S-box-containing protein
VLAVGAVAYQRSRDLVKDVGEVERSHEVIEVSDGLLTRAVDAETGQRAYLLLGDPKFLDPYNGAQADVSRAIDSLRPLILDEPSQLARLDSISRIIAERFALLATGIEAFQRGDAAVARSHQRILAGKEKMDRLRAVVSSLQFYERKLLDARHAAERRSVRDASLVVGSASIIAIALSGLITLVFSRAITERDTANVALKQVNEDLEEQSRQMEMQAVEMESQAAELEATAEDLRSTNDRLNRTTHAAETARDAAEGARRRLEVVLDNLPDAANVFDAKWRWTYANPTAKRMLRSIGIDGSEIVGKVIWDVLPQLKGTRFEKEATRAVKNATLAEFEEYHPDLDAWLESSIVPLSGAVMTFSRDITHRKREQQGARLLADASRALASTLDYEKTLHAVARLAVGDLADWCAVDLAGDDGTIRQVVVSHKDEAKVQWAKDLNKRYPPDRSGASGAAKVIKTGKPEIYPEISDEMLVAGARDAAHLSLMRDLQFRSALLVPMTARGRTLGAMTLVSTEMGRRYGEGDLALATELATRAAIAIDNAQLYRGALAASEAKSAFLATISHELRTPLNAIIGYASLLEEGIGGALTPPQVTQLGRIRASAGHLLGLIDEVLTFSRVDAGKEVIRQDQVDLSPLVRDAIAMVAPSAAAKGLTLVYAGPELQLITDEGKLRQILLNLLSNAIKFSDRGEIVVSSEDRADSILISIADSGIGIAAENLERIFDPFWQVEQRSTRRVGGTGLGLSVSRNLARLLGGDVTVESTAEKGSTFTITLPKEPL